MFSHIEAGPLDPGKMELTLRYRGELPACTTGNSRVPEKQIIRSELSPQLERLWQRDNRLKDIDINTLQIAASDGTHFQVVREIKSHQFFFWQHKMNGYRFIPLVTYVHELHVQLDIRIYREMENDGVHFRGGDMDNRLKTLFDALTVPMRPEQVPKHPASNPNVGEWPPLFCLMDDDKSVTGLSVRSVKLLTPVPTHIVHPENFVELEIDVTVTPATAINGNYPMLFP